MLREERETAERQRHEMETKLETKLERQRHEMETKLESQRHEMETKLETQLNDKPSPPAPTPHRQLQQPGGTRLPPPPSGTCPDVTGVQQGLDRTDALVDALEVYTDVSAAPRGLIAMWSGAVDTVPQGWALCDGNAGTPDLRDKFVVGAGSRYELGSSTDVGENVGATAGWVRETTFLNTFSIVVSRALATVCGLVWLVHAVSSF